MLSHLWLSLQVKFTVITGLSENRECDDFFRSENGALEMVVSGWRYDIKPHHFDEREKSSERSRLLKLIIC
ncbi:MAG: hypothetical protein ACTSYQ_01050 [Candidatus Odinarchaeia archaeon]